MCFTGRETSEHRGFGGQGQALYQAGPMALIGSLAQGHFSREDVLAVMPSVKQDSRADEVAHLSCPVIKQHQNN